MQNNKLKMAFRTIVIVSLVCITFFIAGLFLYPLIDKADGVTYFQSLKPFASRTIGAFTYPFVESLNRSQDFALYYQNGFNVNPLIISITTYIVIGIGLILFILSAIKLSTKKKGKLLFYLPLVLVATAIAVILLANGPVYFVTVNNYASHVEGISAGLAVLALLVLTMGVLSFFFVYAGYVMTFVLAKDKVEVNSDEINVYDNEQPVMPEEMISDEVVVDTGDTTTTNEVTSTTDDFTPSYVPEIEPEPEAEQEIIEEKEEPVVLAEPIPEPAQDDKKSTHMEVNINTAPTQPGNNFDQNSFSMMIKDMLRDIVRDEISRNMNNQQNNKPETVDKGEQTVTGATFGGPLVVQYFNGGINGVNPEPKPEPKPAPVEEKKEDRKVEEKKETPKPVEERAVEEKKEEKPVEEKAEEISETAPTPVVEERPSPVPPVKEKVVYERLSFAERLLQSDKELHTIYNDLKNDILSYGVKSRISAVGDTFRLHKKMYVRITVAGKSLKLYFALNPDDYKDSKIPVQDAGNKGLYAEIPLVFKVRSELSIRRAKELIQDCMDKDGLEQGEIGKVNWIKELKAEVNEAKKRKTNSNDEDED